MKERIIVRSEREKVGGLKVFIVLFIISLVLCVGLYVAHEIVYKYAVEPYYDAFDEMIENTSDWSSRDSLYKLYKEFDETGFEDICWLLEDYSMYTGIAAVAFFVIFVILLVIEIMLMNTQMIVSDKRVYGFTGRKRVDLPIDSVSAISLGSMNSVSVTTSSGAIKFSLIKNRDAIYDAVSALLLERQNQKNAPAPAPSAETIVTDNTDQLKKYKDLLDSGVITEEEFNAKKKQLLGL